MSLTDHDIERIAERVVQKLNGEQTRPLSVQQAAERLQVSTRTIRRMIESGELKRVPGTSRTLVTAASLQQLTA